ncbi:hypothetical protein KCU89_g2, partial [Aureobasidium melanogenum]
MLTSCEQRIRSHLHTVVGSGTKILCRLRASVFAIACQSTESSISRPTQSGSSSAVSPPISLSKGIVLSRFRRILTDPS